MASLSGYYRGLAFAAVVFCLWSAECTAGPIIGLGIATSASAPPHLSVGISTISGELVGPAAGAAAAAKSLGLSWSHASMLSDLKYYPSDPPASDDQLILDVMTHCGYVDDIEKPIHALLPWSQIFSIIPTGGDMTNATIPDREYVTLAILRRSENNIPPPVLPVPGPAPVTESSVNAYLDTTYNVVEGDFRLFSRFGVGHGSISSAGTITAYTTDPSSTTRFGPTCVMLRNVVVHVFAGGVSFGTIRIPNGAFNLKVANSIDQSVFENYDNGKVALSTSNKVVYQRCAARIGVILRPLENEVLGVPGSGKAYFGAPPFYSELAYTGLGSSDFAFTPNYSNLKSYDPSQEAETTTAVWTSITLYEFNYATGNYNPGKYVPEVETPFDGFLYLVP